VKPGVDIGTDPVKNTLDLARENQPRSDWRERSSSWPEKEEIPFPREGRRIRGKSESLAVKKKSHLQKRKRHNKVGLRDEFGGSRLLNIGSVGGGSKMWTSPD